jgi:N-carbamoylputrescine amidase
MIDQAGQQGAQIICLPELFSMPYPCQSEDHRMFDWAEPLDGPTVSWLKECSANNNVVLVGSVFERRQPGVYHNTAVVCESGKFLGFYRKTHIPDDPHYFEKFYFTPGDVGYPVFSTRWARIAVGICWDQWFPEVARLFALAGAEILLYPTAIGWLLPEKEQFGTTQHAAWELMHRSHAVANGFFVAAANRVGVESNIEFWGASLLCDPNGSLVARGTFDQQEIILGDCPLEKIDVVRTHWPFLRDRRIDTYDGLLRRSLVP